MKTKLINLMTLLMAVIWLNKEQLNGQTISQDMILIPAGTFEMGDTFNEGLSDELPLHTVYVSAFYIEKYEVTKALWSDTRTWATTHDYSFDSPTIDGKFTNHPVNSATWFNCLKWCNARSEKEGLVPAYYTSAIKNEVYRIGQINIQNDWVKWDAGYRLPTEAEWEKATRGGVAGLRFPWGNTISWDRANYDAYPPAYNYDVNPTSGNNPIFLIGGFPYTSPVGYFAPNKYGLYDTVGNVWEWCWDRYGGYSAEPQIDPRGPTSGTFRIIRGGGWNMSAGGCRNSFRYGISSTTSYYYNGFRCALGQVLPDWCAVTPPQPSYGNCPVKESGKDNLIVLTHGWINKIIHPISPPEPNWIENTKTLLDQYLRNDSLQEWQTCAYKWVDKAWVRNPQTALQNAKEEGFNLGKCIANQNWRHVHLIAHSAGSALIQSATEVIKASSPSTTVHTTFLDAFVGFDREGVSLYGNKADWSDSYFSRDLETGGEICALTEGPLEHAYNVDVTWLDPIKTQIDFFESAPGTTVSHCYETASSHEWPYTFYQKTITGDLADTQGFGFPLSKEGGDWEMATGEYADRGNTPRSLGISDPPCFVPINETTPPTIGPTMNFSSQPIIKSPTGIIDISGNSFSLVTGSPVWLIATVEITNTVDTLSFDASFFSGAGAEGLLTVFWETNSIGSVDERITPRSLTHFNLHLPESPKSGFRSLGFRLDAFTATESIVTVTNVALGTSTEKRPFSLRFSGMPIESVPILELNGPSSINYIVESSTNLQNWRIVAKLVNTNGTVRFVDQSSTNATTLFYRAVAP